MIRTAPTAKTSAALTWVILGLPKDPLTLIDGSLNLKWTHLAPDNTSLFLKDEAFRAAIKRQAIARIHDDLRRERHVASRGLE